MTPMSISVATKRSESTLLLALTSLRATWFTKSEGEPYTGVLLSLIWRSMPDLGPSFAQFAAGLKREAERAR